MWEAKRPGRRLPLSFRSSRAAASWASPFASTWPTCYPVWPIAPSRRWPASPLQPTPQVWQSRLTSLSKPVNHGFPRTHTNQKQIAANTYSKAGDVKSGRGGAALLSGFLACARCGRRLSIAYRGHAPRQAVYRCNSMDLTGTARCMTFGGSRVDVAIAKELLRAVQPMAIEAAMEAERMHLQTLNEQRRVVELDLVQARYEATLAERRYAACDPDNRLIAAQLENSWESTLRRVEACQVRLDAICAPAPDSAAAPDFTGLAEDLEAAWNAPGVTMRARQQLVRALVADIIADVDEKAREVILTIHWQGGQHSQIRIRKPRTGEHGRRTTDEALAVIRSMSCRWSDQDIAASLNRM